MFCLQLNIKILNDEISTMTSDQISVRKEKFYIRNSRILSVFPPEKIMNWKEKVSSLVLLWAFDAHSDWPGSNVANSKEGSDAQQAIFQTLEVLWR